MSVFVQSADFFGASDEGMCGLNSRNVFVVVSFVILENVMIFFDFSCPIGFRRRTDFLGN